MANQPTIPDESELVRRSQSGDQDAFGTLVQRTYRLVIHVAYRTTNDAVLAEEIAQETYLKAWRALPRFKVKDGGSFKAWVCRIAVNTATDAGRRARPTVELDPYMMVSNIHDPETAYLRQERDQTIRQAVMALSEGSREALILREYGGLSYREIAEVLQIPIGTVMSRLNYGRQQLKGALRPWLDEESEP